MKSHDRRRLIIYDSVFRREEVAGVVFVRKAYDSYRYRSTRFRLATNGTLFLKKKAGTNYYQFTTTRACKRNKIIIKNKLLLKLVDVARLGWVRIRKNKTCSDGVRFTYHKGFHGVFRFYAERSIYQWDPMFPTSKWIRFYYNPINLFHDVQLICKDRQHFK